MNSLFQCKPTILPLFIAGVLACFGLLPKAPAVVPPPDGGYPGFTTAEGQNALFSLTTGAGNTAVGWRSLFSNAEGSFNTATGAGALLLNTANNNTAFGAAALLLNTTGSRNTAVGITALQSNTTGAGNTAVGASALSSNTTADFNTAIGRQALFNNTGSGNTALGSGAGFNVSTANNVICIGTGGQNVSDSVYIGNIAGQTVGQGGANCLVDNDGKLGVFFSARRYKENIRRMDEVSTALFSLKPVTFRYKPEFDKSGTPHFGLVAEEVAKVNPDLVTHDAKGELYTVRYEAINVMLLNEFLKEHRKNSEQEATIARLIATDTRQQKQIEALTAALQKVSAQLELREPAPQVVDNE